MGRKCKWKKLALSGGFLASLGMASFSSAADNPPFHITGTTFATIKTDKIDVNGAIEMKTIALLKVLPSEEFINKKKEIIKNMRFGGIEHDYSKGIIPFSQSPGAVEIGMNGVPVLDQGQYGTCVTFATTAAMDAILKVGNFISQQCALELTRALGNNYWNGAYYASDILVPLKNYGLVQQGKCNAVYPNPSAMITLTGYRSRIDKQVTAKKIQYKYYSPLTLETVKAAIDAGHRVAIGFGLTITQDPVSVQGFDVIMNGKRNAGGLWACSQNSSLTDYCASSPNAGHEVVITGYDEKQELLKIRNSWGTYVSDQGEFYMTYAFFRKMNGDGTEMW